MMMGNDEKWNREEAMDKLKRNCIRAQMKGGVDLLLYPCQPRPPRSGTNQPLPVAERGNLHAQRRRWLAAA